jgi:hypothetical protein
MGGYLWKYCVVIAPRNDHVIEKHAGMSCTGRPACGSIAQAALKPRSGHAQAAMNSFHF